MNLVQDEQDALFIAPGAHLLQVTIIGDIDPSLSLNGLQHHGTDLFTRGSPDGTDIIVIHMDKAFRQWNVRLLMLELPGCGDHRQGATVKGAHRRNDLIGTIQVEPAISAGELHRPFSGLSTAIAEEDPVQAAILDKKLRQAYLGHSIKLI